MVVVLIQSVLESYPNSYDSTLEGIFSPFSLLFPLLPCKQCNGTMLSVVVHLLDLRESTGTSASIFAVNICHPHTYNK